MPCSSSFRTRASSVALIRAEGFASGAYAGDTRTRLPSGSPVAAKLLDIRQGDGRRHARLTIQVGIPLEVLEGIAGAQRYRWPPYSVEEETPHEYGGKAQGADRLCDGHDVGLEQLLLSAAHERERRSLGVATRLRLGGLYDPRLEYG